MSNKEVAQEAVQLPGQKNVLWNKMLAIAEKRNIYVCYDEMFCKPELKGLDGVLIRKSGATMILLSMKLTGGKRDFVMAHELAHSVLHPNFSMFHSSDQERNKVEREADKLAWRLLGWLERRN